MQDINKDTEIWKDDDNLSDYRGEIQKSFFESVKEVVGEVVEVVAEKVIEVISKPIKVVVEVFSGVKNFFGRFL